MTSGAALQMRWRLAQLVKRHGTPPPDPQRVPRLPDCDGAVILSGLASDYAVDLERVLFVRGALSWFPWSLPPLFHKHHPTPIGKVTSLAYANEGLRISVQTDHPKARNCPAFSIAATIRSYSIRDADSAMNYHALVSSAWVDEISLVDRPANPRALVQERQPVAPEIVFYDQLSKRLQKLVGGSHMTPAAIRKVQERTLYSLSPDIAQNVVHCTLGQLQQFASGQRGALTDPQIRLLMVHFRLSDNKARWNDGAPRR